MHAQRYVASSHVHDMHFSGEFGIVYKARLSKGFNKPYNEVVAVKTLKGVHIIATAHVHFFRLLFQDLWRRL